MSEATHEGNSLSSVSVRPQFSWIEGGRNDKAVPFDASPFMHDLVLWNILGFALDNENYSNLMLVCQDWKEMVLKLYPPFIREMGRLLEPTTGVIEIEPSVQLLKRALVAARNRASSLYRHAGSSTTEFPVLQPHFNIVLMRFAHTICTQRSPFNGSREKYDMIKELLTDETHTALDKLQESLIFLGRDCSKVALEHMVQIWCDWKGHMDRVVEIGGYLDRYYVKHHNLPSLDSIVYSAMANGLIRVANEKLNLTIGVLVRIRNTSVDPSERALLLEASRACEHLAGGSVGFTLVAPQDVQLHYRSCLEAHATTLEQARKEERDMMETKKKNDQQEGKTITIMSCDKVKFELPEDCKFLTSSGFLKRLHLRPGDAIQLNFEGLFIQKSIDFYKEDNYPIVEQPLRSSVMEDLVGPVFAAMVDSMNQGDLFQWTSFANQMDLQAVLSLCCAKVASLIRGRTPDEIRRIFNIQDDFNQENRWAEDD